MTELQRRERGLQQLPPPSSEPWRNADAGGLLFGALCTATAWSIRWSFFGTVIGPFVLVGVTLGVGPAFHSIEGPFVTSLLGGFVGALVGAVGGVIQELIATAGWMKVREDTAAGGGLGLLGIATVLSIGVLLDGALASLIGAAFWVCLIKVW